MGNNEFPKSQDIKISADGFNTDGENVIDGEEIILPVIEEFVTIDKKIIDKAKVSLSKTVSTNVENISVSLFEDQISVERISVNRFVESIPPVRYDGDVMILSIVKEVAVVEKRLMLVEELHIVKNKIEKNEIVEVSLRKESIDIIRTQLNPEN